MLNQYKMSKEHTYANILKIIIDQRDDYTTGCQLAYPHFNEDFNTIPIGLNKLQAFNSHGEAIQKINLLANKRSARKTPIFFIFKGSKEIVLFSSQGLLGMFYFNFNVISI